MATGLFSLLIANLLDVTQIAVVASADFLVIFSAVNLAAWKLARQTENSRIVPTLSSLASTAALVVLLFHASRENPIALILIVSSWIACMLFEFIYQRATQRTFVLDNPPRSPQQGTQ